MGLIYFESSVKDFTGSSLFCSQWEYEDQERTERQERERIGDKNGRGKGERGGDPGEGAGEGKNNWGRVKRNTASFH